MRKSWSLWLAVALALSYVACSAHAGVSKPEPIVAKEFSFSDELNDAFVVALGESLSVVARRQRRA